MYRLLENLMLYAPGENSIIGRTALLCEKARSGGTGLKREASVSYTHLDVYKRQEHVLSRCRS